MKPLRVEFCGEWFDVTEPEGLSIGRDSDLIIDDNPFLHRRFLQIYPEHGLWWIGNTGNQLSATVTDGSGHVQAWLGPGARLPIVFAELSVLFSAGSTTYDFRIVGDVEHFASTSRFMDRAGSTTLEPIPLTTTQRMLIVALCEHLLRDRSAGRAEIPTSAHAAERLGWTLTAFNRKLDNVCDKLDRSGVAGLRGGRGNLATHRRARLVEYAVSTKLVTVDDLPLLDRPRPLEDPE
ncbi:MAG: hypothetical protein ABI435_00950 [Pseudolysinimonas sp.]